MRIVSARMVVVVGVGDIRYQATTTITVAMFVFCRRVQPVPLRCRAYSSFFSSKAGGRYFNSAKPPKSVVNAANKSKAVDSAPSDNTAGNDSPAGKASTGGGNSANEGHQMLKSAATATAHETPAASPVRQHSHSQPQSQPQSQNLPYHPPVNSNDFKLHQFFSLHRPLLLLSQPTSVIFDTPPPIPPTNPLSSLGEKESASQGPPAQLGTLDDPPEASPEADADAARQLARALVMSRVGGTLTWEATLKRLGINLELDEGRVELKEKLVREWEQVMLDSTRRKRRAKMKKHK